MSLEIALVGNPNCGKSTIFNFVAKSTQKVGNWPGVTVEKKISTFKKNNKIKIIDLPGIYSLVPYSPDEAVSFNYLAENEPKVIVNVISILNLQRSLYLTLQLLELNIPVIVAVTMTDLANKNSDFFDLKILAEKLHCTVIKVSKNDPESNFKLIETAIETAYQQNRNNLTLPKYIVSLNKTIETIEKILQKKPNLVAKNKRLLALGVLENNNQLVKNLNFNYKQNLELKNIIKQNSEFKNQDFLIKQRYEFIDKNLTQFYKQNKKNKNSLSDKIDFLLLNKWLAIPMFFAIISLTYFLGISVIGQPISDYLNHILKNQIVPATSNFLTIIEIQPWLINLICDGIIVGVGSVLTFVPQLLILFFFISFLEECGYMSRVAFITDKICSKFGLCGQSIISFLVSSSCGVNGALATKTIKSPITRLITLTTTTFVPCSAKIPVIAAISSLFLKHSWVVAPVSYIICIIAILTCSLFLKFKTNFKNETTQFLMEMTPYQKPSFFNLFQNTIDNVVSFAQKALTVVLLASLTVWITSHFGIYNNQITLVEPNFSFLASFSKILVPVFKPLGFACWQTISAIITGCLAKENIVSTLENLANTVTPGLNETFSINMLFSSQASALAFLVFNLLCVPCVMALIAIHKQSGSTKLTLQIALIQTATAYIFSLITFHFCSAIFK